MEEKYRNRTKAISLVTVFMSVCIMQPRSKYHARKSETNEVDKGSGDKK